MVWLIDWNSHRHDVPSPSTGIGLVQDVDHEHLSGHRILRQTCDEVYPVGYKLGLAVHHGRVLGMVIDEDIETIMGEVLHLRG